METKKSSAFTVLPLFPGETENSNLRRINEEDKRYTCVFCRSSEVDEINLGPLYISDGVVTHYFCMLFSAGLSQKGADSDGILGFLPEDILSEVRRATRLKCIYCHTIGAAIGCCDRRCKATFHFSCGLANRANFQFYGNFESFCVNHSKQTNLESIPDDLECPICRNLHESTENIIVGACCKSAVFHKSCIQQHAFTAGYFFKCPTCNSEASFLQDMKAQGVFVPEQDAAWEREPNAYQELLYQYSHCDAENCQCPRGRDYGASKGQWLLARCRTCGSAGTHRTCGNLTTIANWACGLCLEIEDRTEKVKKTVKPKRAYRKASDQSTSSVSLPRGVPPSSNPSIPTAVPSFNGANRKARRSGAKTFMNGIKIEVNSSFVTVHPACRDYFPHEDKKIREYVVGNKSVPDWRSYQLKVELVNVFSDLVGNAASKPGSLAAPQTKKETRKRAAVPTREIIGQVKRQRNASTEKRSNRKRGSWKKGVVKSRKRRSKSKSMSVSSLDHQKDVHTNVNNFTSDPPAAVSSKAVLEGIRRSQSSLISWLSTTSSGPAKSIVKIEKAIKTEPGISDENQIRPQEKRTNGVKKENTEDLNDNAFQQNNLGGGGILNGETKVNARRSIKKYFLQSPKRSVGTSSNRVAN